jgi:dienelactone hydrolase
MKDGEAQEVAIDCEMGVMSATLEVGPAATGLVLFAHGSGSSRFSPRNRAVARALREAGLGTLLLDLLSAEEERIDQATARLRFDIPLLARRLMVATEWAGRASLGGLPLGYFGASTGAAAALVAAACAPDLVRAVVSRGGRPDLAGGALTRVRAPTLLIVGGHDREVLELNRQALRQLRAPAVLHVIPRATHLFAEPGALEEVAALAAGWFRRCFAVAAPAEAARARPVEVSV